MLLICMAALLEPRDRMLPRALEDVPAVHGAVVVNQDHVALLHRHKHLVPLGHIIDVLQVLRRNRAAVTCCACMQA